ncbi:MAG: hypothetical protein IMZ66_00650 [Planctomycetes bacterium]|nr:hypothetical protein [Planctomycetota bacterium]
MSIKLTTQQIDAAIPKVATGLSQYVWLQARVAGSEAFYNDARFRRRFNHFYRVRRSASWREAFYSLMGRALRQQLQFHAVLDLLREATNRYETSFASKLFATLNPSAPVIDSVVLKNLGLRLPSASAPDRAAAICVLHQKTARLHAAFLKTANGRHLVAEFKRAYPAALITKEKMLDLVLWQTRG